jgi:hypothetical protein
MALSIAIGHGSVLLQRLQLPNPTALASKALAEGWLHR